MGGKELGHAASRQDTVLKRNKLWSGITHIPTGLFCSGDQKSLCAQLYQWKQRTLELNLNFCHSELTALCDTGNQEACNILDESQQNKTSQWWWTNFLWCCQEVQMIPVKSETKRNLWVIAVILIQFTILIYRRFYEFPVQVLKTNSSSVSMFLIVWAVHFLPLPPPAAASSLWNPLGQCSAAFSPLLIVTIACQEINSGF